MLMLQQSQPIFRFLALVTLLTFFPSSIAVWNFIPPVQMVAEAEEPSKSDETAGTEPEATDLPAELAQLSEAELRSLKGGPIRVAKSGPDTASGTAESLRIADASSLPVAATLLSSIPRPKPMEKAESDPEPIKLAQGREIAGPLGPPAASTALDEADALLAAGEYSDAAMAYVQIMDTYPATHESVYADRGIWTIMRLVESGEIGRNALAAFENNLQNFTAQTAEGGYLVVTYFAEMAVIMNKIDDESSRGEYANHAANWALQLIASSPNHYLALGINEYLYDVGELLGEETLASFMAQLEALAETLPPCLGRFGAYHDLALYTADHAHNYGRATIHRANMLSELDSGYLEAIFDDPNVYPWAKGIIGLAIGWHLFQLRNYDEAIARLESTLQYLPSPTKTKRLVAFEIAKCEAHKYAQNPALAVQAYQDFLQAYPDGARADQALLNLGAIYMIESDYTGAVSFFSELIQRFPDSKLAPQAEQELEYLMRNLYESAPVAQDAGASPEADPKLAQLCGPQALHDLLANRGTESNVDELAELAHTDAEGTTMQALIEAAKVKGIELTGIAANSVDELDLPAIAFVNHNHFLLVTRVLDDSVVVLDGPQGERSLTRGEYAAMWDGQALVLGDGSADQLEFAALHALKGGAGGGGSTPVPPPTCESGSGGGGGAGGGGGGAGGGGGGGGGCGDGGGPPVVQGSGGGSGSASGGTGTGGSSPAGGRNNCGQGGPKPGPVSPCGFSGCGTPGDSNSPSSRTGVSSPGVHPIIDALQTGLALNETDSMIGVKGSLSLEFQRAYYNSYGFHRGEFQGTSKPWKNNVGDGWTHNLNMHLVTSAPLFGTPLSVVFYDATGAERTYNLSTTAGGYNYYVPASTSYTSEKGNTLKRNTSTSKWTLEKPGGLVYEFSAATADSYRYARLESIKDTTGNAMTFSYDGAVGTGKLTKVASPDGDTQHLAFSYAGNLITKVDLKATSTVVQTTSFAYNASNELTKVTDHASQDVLYAYASDGSAAGSRMITKITDKGGRETTLDWTFSLDGGTYKANVIDFTNAAGLTTTYDRSVSTSVCTITNWDGMTMLSKFVNTPITGDGGRSRYKDYYLDASNYERWSYEYDSGGNLTKVLRPGNGVYGTYAYNAYGRMITKAGNDGVATNYYYGANGLYVTKMTDKAGLDTLYYYDGYNRLTKTVTPWNGAAGIVAAYDANGNVTSVTDPLNNSRTFGYDSLGRMTSVKDPLNNETLIEYDHLGNVTKTTDPRNKSTYLYYAYTSCGGCGGKAGQLTKVKDALNNETLFAYDDNGNQTKVTDALSRDTDYFYDDMNRLTKVESPSGSGIYMTVSYDLLGRRFSVTDFEGRIKNFYYDHVGRQTKITDPIGTYAEYAFDTSGNLSAVKDGNGNTTTNDYDGGGRLTKLTYPDGKVTKYFYDSADRLTKVGAGASGIVDPTEYFFHGTTGQMTKMRYTAGGTTSDAVYAYDAAARLTKLTDWIDGTDGLRYAYDAAGRLTTLTDYDDSTLEYTYDAAGNVLTMNDFHNSVVTYTYTDTNRVSTITAPGSKVWDYDYNALGQPTSMSIPNGMTTIYGYDTRNRLTKIEHKDGANVLDGFYYALDDGGNITRTTYQDDQYWDYWYDGRDRLTKAERRDDVDTLLHRYAYTYDASDNTITKEIYDGTDTDTFVYEHTVSNELTKQSFDGTDTTFGYDAWGRMTSKSDGAYSASYSYDYGSKLTKVASDFPGEGTAEYEFGADQKRRQRDDGTTVTWYNYGLGWDILNEENGGGTLTMTFVHGPLSSRGSLLLDLVGAAPATATARYYYKDSAGSTRRLRDAAKSSIGEYEYEAYGAQYYESGATIVEKFSGWQWQDESHLYFKASGSYSPFTSESPDQPNDETEQWEKDCGDAPPLSKDDPKACKYGNVCFHLSGSIPGGGRWKLDCICKCMNNSEGDRCMRGCIQCLHDHGVDVTHLGDPDPHDWCRVKCDFGPLDDVRLVNCIIKCIDNEDNSDCDCGNDSHCPC
jgi:YD repeat-containing protein